MKTCNMKRVAIRHLRLGPGWSVTINVAGDRVPLGVFKTREAARIAYAAAALHIRRTIFQYAIRGAA